MNRDDQSSLQPVRPLVNRIFRSTLHHPWSMALFSVSRLFYPRKDGNWVDIERLELSLSRLAPNFDGFRLAQISDIHLGTWINQAALAEVVTLVNHEKPDLIAITGDFVTHSPEKHAPLLKEELSRLRARYGILAILGNHDHWSDAAPIKRALQEAGATELNNKHLTIRRNGASLHFAGVDDHIVKMARLPRVLARLPDQGAAVLLAHEPDFADESAPSGRFDLQISGHSHGGQFLIPGFGPPILPAYSRKYTSGLYRVREMWQYTNRGLGTAEVQIRWNCRPEITIFTLRSPNQPV
ncbi:MAG: metallophosphoesterase [Chloroflexi bacterium]|nr:metallophosphoesterase [Chloroflexota bacterium]